MEYGEGLAKEVLVVLFRAFPGHFVLVGGGALHWIFHSPRFSIDLDLKPLHPTSKGLLNSLTSVLNRELSSWAITRAITIECRTDEAGQAVRILTDGRPVLHVELVSLSPVGGREKHLLQSDSFQSEIIVTPDIHQLLFSKAAALLKRPQVKGRDVFDIWFLQSRGAILDKTAFADWLKWEELDSEDLQKTLKAVTPKRLQSDLARFLPDSIQQSLAQENYKSLVEAAHGLLEPFL